MLIGTYLPGLTVPSYAKLIFIPDSFFVESSSTVLLANAGFEYLYERHIIHKQNNIDKYNFLYITEIFLIHIQINS